MRTITFGVILTVNSSRDVSLATLVTVLPRPKGRGSRWLPFGQQKSHLSMVFFLACRKPDRSRFFIYLWLQAMSLSNGSEAWIRTNITRARTLRPTIRRPRIASLLYLFYYLNQEK